MAFVAVLQGLLLAVILGVLAVVGGILANWIPRPANAKTRWVLAGLAGVVLVAAVIGLLGDGRQQPSDRRPLQAWVSDVNKRCEASRGRTEAARKRREAAQGSSSPKEQVPALKDLEAAHSDLYKQVSDVELPSEPDDHSKAQDWLQTYGVRRDRLADFVKLMDGLPDRIGPAQAFDATKIDEAAQSYAEATTTATRQSEALGISCP